MKLNEYIFGVTERHRTMVATLQTNRQCGSHLPPNPAADLQRDITELEGLLNERDLADLAEVMGPKNAAMTHG